MTVSVMKTLFNVKLGPLDLSSLENFSQTLLTQYDVH